MRINIPFWPVTFILLFSAFTGYSQSEDANKYNSEYQKNIQKTHINGIYIPKDMADAFSELNRLISQDNKVLFKSEDEIEACRSLFFSLGRWITIKWQFYEGSRFSHYLNQVGIKHPDDMVFFTLILYHRHLSKKDLDVKNLVEQLNNKTLIPRKEND